VVTLSLPDASSNNLTDLNNNHLPSPGFVGSEVHCWQHKWQRHLDIHGLASLPSIPAQALKETSEMMFPNVRTLLTILCVLPVTTCTSERSHSSLKMIKTRLRSTMGNDRLTA
jgi:hypothetical protein